MGAELKLSDGELENLRIASLLHEVGTADQRLLKLLSRSVTDESVAVARALRGPRRSSPSTRTTTRSWATIGTSRRCRWRSREGAGGRRCV